MARLLENSRLCSLGVSLAAGVLTPAVYDISREIGRALSPRSARAVRDDPELVAQVAAPISLRP